MVPPYAGVALQADGKVVIAGGCTSLPDCFSSSSPDFVVARLLTDGSIDTSFGSGGVARTDFTGQTDFAQALLLQPDGRIVVTGRADQNIVLARFDGAGALDSTFGTGGKTVSSS